MAVESTRKDSLKVEKVSLLVLTLCIVVLVCLLIFRPF
jgi:predicted RND superfamily exporter protein